MDKKKFDLTPFPSEPQRCSFNLINMLYWMFSHELYFPAKSECISWHEKKSIHVELFEEMICAGYKNKTVDACLGDRFDRVIEIQSRI